jgi:predicted lipoprotein with Yx(FWY)xxD motif
MKALSLLQLTFVISIGAVVLVAAAFAGTMSTHRTQRSALVALRKTTLGRVLVDARGRTLYLFEKDRNAMSACDAACAKFWPPVVSRSAPRAAAGVHKAMLGLTKRKDGRSQVTYAGHPLYTFVGDKAAGRTSGEGLANFGAKWYALAPSGHVVEVAQPSPPSSGGYGHGAGR